MVDRGADEVFDVARAMSQRERPAQHGQAGLHVSALSLQDAKRGQAMGVLGGRPGLPRYLDRPLRQRQGRR